MTATTTTTTTTRGARHAPLHSAVGPRRPYRSSSSSSSSSSSPSRPLLLPAVFSALLLVVLLAGTAAAAEGDGDSEPKLSAKVGKPPVPVAPAPRTPEGLYFFLTSKAPRRCFVLTEGKGSMFHVHYDFPAANEGEEVTLELRQLSDDSTPKNRFSADPIQNPKKITEVEGTHQFTITSKKDTTFSLCAVTSNKNIQGRGLKLYLDLDTGKQDTAYENYKKQFSLDDVQISMIQLKNKAQQMLRTADYSKELETVYHKLLLKLNRAVLWWPVSQVVILVVMGFYQVRHLKKFFKSKRLV